MDRFVEMETFLRVAERGSFAAAARDLGRSAPAVTRLINALEARLGTSLIIRTTRSLRLTESGMRFMAECRELQVALREAEDAARGIHADPQGQLRVTAPVMFGRLHVAPNLADFVDQHPGVQAEALFLDRNINLIEENLDAAFRIGHLADSGLAAIRVGQVRHICVAAPAYLARHGTPATPEDLGAHQVIHASAVHAAAHWPFMVAGERRNLDLKPRLRLNTNDSVIDLARQGRGLVHVWHYQAADHLANGSLVEVLGAFAPKPEPIHILHLDARRTSARVRAFVDFMATRLRSTAVLQDVP